MDKFDEYSLFSSLVQHKSQRRQAASQTYLTVNTVIFGVLAFLVKDAGLGVGGGQLAVVPGGGIGLPGVAQDHCRFQANHRLAL